MWHDFKPLVMQWKRDEKGGSPGSATKVCGRWCASGQWLLTITGDLDQP